MAPHSDFNRWYVRNAVLFAALAGFAMGSHVTAVDGFGLSPGLSYFAIIQTHGYLQVMGWVGLFIMGVSLYFFPRISHIPISATAVRVILWLVTAGLILRYILSNVTPYLLSDSVWLGRLNWLIFIGTVMVWAGTLGYVYTLASSAWRTQQASVLAKLGPIRGFLFMTLLGWTVYNSTQVVLVFQMLVRHTSIVDPYWNDWSLQAFTLLVIIPICFAMSIRTLPLYMKLAPVRWRVDILALFYAVGVGAELYAGSGWWTGAGIILRCVAVLWFIWKLDVLTKLRPDWTTFVSDLRRPQRKTARDKYPDYGEWGRFELLVQSAYVWLTVAMIFTIAGQILSWTSSSVSIYLDGIRHLILLGFASMLIFGMGPRMIPAFLHHRKTAWPGAVMITFWLGNLALILRVVPILFTGKSFSVISGAAYGASGIVGLAAITGFAVSIWKSTVHPREDL